MSNKILFYSDKNSERLQYTLKLVFSDILGLDVFFTQSSQVFISSVLPKINYSDSALSEGDIFIKSNELLFENHIIKRDFEKEFQDFDIFSKIFILVSRYEEYIATLPSNRDGLSVFDTHGRFTAKASFSTKLGILKIPIVNQWALEIGEQLKAKFPDLKMSTPRVIGAGSQYQVQLTYDIDQAWAFKNKGFLRNIGGLLKDVLKLNFKSIFTRLKVLINIKNDPEYTFDYIEKLHKKHDDKLLNPIFFWLLADFGEHDKNIEWTNTHLQRLIRRLAKKHPVGIHPSYASNLDDAILKKEIERLNKILPDTEGVVTKSRQHYLKLRFPITYQRLIQLGITDDYSMGYSDDIGFRAGIASPFYWYDLENERTTTLRVHPFQVMEVTLNEYLHLSPDEAIERVKPIIESIKAVGGTFTMLWHNSTLTDNEASQPSERGYEGWRKVYEEIIEMAIL
jgi:hypothetical protein